MATTITFHARWTRAAIAGAVLASLSAAIGASFSKAALPSTQPANPRFAADTDSATPADSTSTPASPSGALITQGLDGVDSITLAPGKTRKITTSRKIKRANILSSDVADVIPLAPDEILVTPKKPGTTQLIVWDETDHSQVVDVVILSDVVSLDKQLKSVFPADKIVITEVNGSLALHGHVKTLQEADQAVQISAPYSANGKILNLLEVSGGQQIMLQVRFAEVSKTAASNLGVNFGFSDGTSFFGNNVGQVNPFGTSGSTGLVQLASASPNPAITLFGQAAAGKEAFQYFISALRSNNVLRMLAEPDLVTTSGQEANFLAGGEFPIPVTQGGGSGGGTSVTIEYKEFGVKLSFVPVILGDGRIRMKVAPEVSDLDFSTAVKFNGFVVPGLNTRRVNTTVELSEGQTFAIAGLLNNNFSANTSELPGLGEIPILGALFRSTQYQRKETELVVLVTPVLVKALDPADVPLVPGEKWRYPNESDMFFLGDMGGDNSNTDHAPSQEKGPAPRFHGAYGFRPPEQPAMHQ